MSVVLSIGLLCLSVLPVAIAAPIEARNMNDNDAVAHLEDRKIHWVSCGVPGESCEHTPFQRKHDR